MSWLVETIVATTLLMLLVLLIRGHVAALFGARAAYMLWLLPALRMILPPLPENFGPAPIAHLPAAIDFAMIEVAPALPAVQPAIPWGSILLVLWLGGAALLIAWQLFAYHRFVSDALARSTALPEMDKDGIEVCASPSVEGPFAAGILTPTVVLPHDWRTRYTKEELRLALRHEAVHHLRGDLGVNFVALVMLSLHWFNPVAWRAWRAFRADQELACDAVVLDGAGPQERHSYGLALVKSACSRTPVAACSLNPRDQLKQRLRMMRAGTERRVSGRALAGALTLGGLVLTASGGIAAERTRGLREQVTAEVIAPVVKAVAQAAPAGLAPATAEGAAARASEQAADAAAAAADTREIVEVDVDESVREAIAEMHDAREAVSDAAIEAHEALEDAAEARAEAMRELRAAGIGSHRVVRHAWVEARGGMPAGKCKDKKRTVAVDVPGENGSERRQLRVLVCGTGLTHDEMRALNIEALHAARRGLAEAEGVNADHIAKALAGIDAELARLRAMKPTI